MTALSVTVLACCWIQFFIGFWNGIFEEKKDVNFFFFFFFSFISFTDQKFWNEKLCTYLVVSCKWQYITLSLLILRNSFILFTHNLQLHLYHTVFWKESSNINGHHFHLISTKQTTTSISNLWIKKRPHNMEIQILVWDRHKNVVGNVFKIWL